MRSPLLIFSLVFSALFSNICIANKALSDNDIRELIVQEKTSLYYTENKCTENYVFPNNRGASVCFCGCPNHNDQKGNKCGANSYYYENKLDQSKNGFIMQCYPEDVMDYEVQNFRSKHIIPHAEEK